MTRVSGWVIGVNVALAVAMLSLAIASGVGDPWFAIFSGVAIALIIGIVLEVRGSRWSVAWNVGVFLAVAAASLMGGSLVDLILPNSNNSEGAVANFLMFGVPALVLAVVNFVVFRRHRRVNAA